MEKSKDTFFVVKILNETILRNGLFLSGKKIITIVGASVT